MKGLAVFSLLVLCAAARAADAADPVPPVLSPQKPYAECVSDPERYLAMSHQDFDQNIQPVEGGPRVEAGWREIARRDNGCFTAIAELMSRWRDRHKDELMPYLQSFMAFHEAQFRAGGGDYDSALELFAESRAHSFTDPAGVAYVDAIAAFLRSDRDALMAARERLLAVPEPANWPELQRLYREQAGQEMQWPRNIEATDRLVECFGRPYPVMGDC